MTTKLRFSSTENRCHNDCSTESIGSKSKLSSKLGLNQIRAMFSKTFPGYHQFSSETKTPCFVTIFIHEIAPALPHFYTRGAPLMVFHLSPQRSLTGKVGFNIFVFRFKHPIKMRHKAKHTYNLYNQYFPLMVFHIPSQLSHSGKAMLLFIFSFLFVILFFISSGIFFQFLF